MEREAKKLLLDIFTASQAIQEFNAGKSLHDYERSRLLRSATERELVIMGEAFDRLDKLASDSALKAASKEEIISVRNRILHNHDPVDDVIVWNVIQNNLPGLCKEVEKLIG
jgi:uncharacterized protein with HEPN domain